ncbi:MAG: bifunctional diguanylate cyclase/phosphodiesterase [Solirubrobacterales bacterium]|nr:bifunctional diguanylate cyclase/phosphodiesterase [Solirubrobacterales bacterium]
MLALGTVVAVVLHQRIERRALLDAERTGMALSHVASRSVLHPSDLDAPVTGLRRVELDVRLADALRRSGALRVKLFNRSNVHVYSDDHAIIGRDGGPKTLTALQRGKVFSHVAHGVVDNGRGVRALEVYIPIELVRKQRGPDGVLEIYLPYEAVASDIADDTRTLVGLLAAGLLVLWLSLFNIVRRASRRLRRQALHDDLTGLANRARLRDHGAHMLEDGRRENHTAALLLVDLDRFKEINDTLGHDQGDALLCEAADRLRDVLRHDDLLARLGGDEFAILLPRLPHRGAAAELATRVRAALERPYALAGVTVEVEASIGIALYPEDGDDVAELLRRADVAMYDAKHNRSGIEAYDRARDPHSPERLALLAELRRAVEADELVLHFQPKVALPSGAVSGVEALVRWQHPQHGLMPPGEFLPLAERTGLITDLTRWVLDAALRQARAWLDDGLDLPIAVNLTAANVLDVSMPDVVAEMLERHGVPGDRLICEISENTILADPRRTAASLQRLRAMGVGLALDDFGAGQSSMAYLKDLPLDELKIDRSFVASMGGDASDAAIVRATIDLGRHLGLRVVAEGVETGDVYADLAGLRCDVVQGYLVSRPLPAGDLRAWLGSRRQADPATAL